MDKSRNYILDRITSKKTTPAEFNFDALQAPPLGLFFTPYDIDELRTIATSIKYAARPNEKYAAIDRVCKRLGLVKFGAGTNRVVYRHPEFPDILFKIAADAVGMQDNPAEFRNQWILKPFVCKIFEISPCGTVALVERVVPITSREEFISVADDVFELITEWLIGEYVLADIGAKYFMNHGIRRNFGVVLLDYSFLYKLDGNKLYCNKKDPTSPTGKCEGLIDYDDAFSSLVCTKCGAIYKAKELELAVKSDKLVKEGAYNTMKIKTYGGSTNTSNTVDNSSPFKKFKTAIRPNSVDEVSATARTNNNTNTTVISFGGNSKPKKEERLSAPINSRFVNGVVDNPSFKVVVDEPKKVDVVKEAKPVEEVEVEPVVEEKEEQVDLSVPSTLDKISAVVGKEKTDEMLAKIAEEHPVQSAFSMSEEIKAEALANKKELPEKGAVQTIDDLMSEIEKNLDLIEIDSVKNDALYRLIKIIASNMPKTLEAFNDIIDIICDNYADLSDDDYVTAFSTGKIIDLFKKVFSATVNTIDVKFNEEGGIDIDYEVRLSNAWVEEDDEEYGKLGIMEDGTITLSSESLKEMLPTPAAPVTVAPGNYNGFTAYHAKIDNIKSLFPTEKLARTVLVLCDDNERYACGPDGNIIVATDIDNKYVDSVRVVSAEWLEGITKQNEETEDGVEAVETAPVGALPPVEDAMENPKEN